MLKLSFYNLLFLIITFLATFGILIETFSYSGIIRSNFLFDIRILVLFSVLLAVLNLLRKSTEKRPFLIYQINRLIFLPITAILTIALTTLELINYPNFIFSTFHLNYDSFFYLFVISFSVFIFYIDKKRLFLNKEISIFIFSIILITSFGIIRSWPQSIFFTLIKEDNLFENLQFVFYFFSASLALFISLKGFSKKNKLVFIYFLGFSLFLFFISGEEISWGQRIFGITSPEIAKEINTQNETSIHNIKGLNDLQPIMYMTFSFYLSTSWMFIKALHSKYRKLFSQLVPDWYMILYFLPILFFYTHINILGGKHWEWQEACELIMAIGLFIFFFKKVSEEK